MKNLGSSFPLFMWLSIFILQCNAVCTPVEEDMGYFFHCSTRPANATITLTAGNDTNQRNIAFCSKQGCTDLDPTLSSSTRTLHGNKLSATFEIKSVSRVKPFNMETKWGCRPDSKGHDVLDTICDPLLLYAKAAHPVCGTPKYTEATHTEIFLNCETDRVYPKAVPSFAAVLDDGNEKHLSGPLMCYTSTVSNNPVYYSTGCLAVLPLSSIPKSVTSLVVDMRPSVPGLLDEKFTRLQIPLATPSAALHTDCPAGDVKNGYIKSGTTATCRCMVTTSGYPAGQAQWYTLNGTEVGTRNGSDGSASLTIREPPQTHYCLAESFSGKSGPISFPPKFGTTPSVTLHPDCPAGDVKNGYIKSGTTATCRCMVTTSGYPAGQAQWYTLNGTEVGTRNGSDGSASLTIREPSQTHYCVAESFIGKSGPISFSPKFGTFKNDPFLSNELIIGLCVGGAVVLLNVFFAVYVCCCRHCKGDKTSKGRSDDSGSQVQRSHGQLDENTLGGIFDLQRGMNVEHGYIDPIYVSEYSCSSHPYVDLYDTVQEQYANPREMEPYSTVQS